MPRAIYKVSAHESTDFSGGNRKLTVSADIETLNGNETLRLVEASPQGINPMILILTVDVSHAGGGTDVLGCATVSYGEAISRRQYSHVTVTTADNSTTVNVQHWLS